MDRDDEPFGSASVESLNAELGKVPEFFKPCWLTTEGLTSFMSWKRKWFMLDSEEKALKYYDSEEAEGKPAGVFLISKDSQVAPSTKAPSKGQERFGFLVRTGAKVLHLCAKDETEKATKMREISLMIIHMFPENLAAMQEQERIKRRVQDERNKEHEDSAMATRRRAAEDAAKREQLSKMSLPEKIAAAKTSNELDLTATGLSDFPAQIPKELPNLVTLNLSRNLLQQFPNLFRMLKLEMIDISYNRLVNVPEQVIGEWARTIQTLILNNNLLWGITGELGTCVNLVKLDLRNNALEDIPPGLGRLTRLEELFLENNPKLKAIPDDFGKLQALEIFDASSCALTQLPESITGLTRLLELNLAGNKLSGMPDSMHSMSRLAAINLAQNSLKMMPLVLGRLSGIRKVDFSANPLTDPVEKKLADANNSEATFEYLRPKAMLAASKVIKEKKEVRIDTPYNPQVAKRFTSEMILKLDEIRRELTLAQSIPDAVKHAVVVKNLKPGMEAINALIPPQDPAPPPVIHPGEDKLSMLQKTAGAALRDSKNAFTALIPVIDKTPFPSKEFDHLTDILRGCRAVLGYQDFTIELK